MSLENTMSYDRVLQMLLNSGYLTKDCYELLRRMPGSLYEKDLSMMIGEQQLHKVIEQMRNESLAFQKLIEDLSLEAKQLEHDLKELKRHAQEDAAQLTPVAQETLAQDIKTVQSHFDKVSKALNRLFQQLAESDTALETLEAELQKLEQAHGAALVEEAKAFNEVVVTAVEDIKSAIKSTQEELLGNELSEEKALAMEAQREELARVIMSGPAYPEQSKQLERVIPPEYRDSMLQEQRTSELNSLIARQYVMLLQLKYVVRIVQIGEDRVVNKAIINNTNSVFNNMQPKVEKLVIEYRSEANVQARQERQDAYEQSVNTCGKRIGGVQVKRAQIAEDIRDLNETSTKATAVSGMIVSSHYYAQQQPAPRGAAIPEVKAIKH